ncbi:MAG: MotA/TolQ/ExbB proton channel family protein [Halopseudomonas sp.]
MVSALSQGALHGMVALLLEPVVWSLFAITAFAMLDIGLAVGERCGGLKRLYSRLSEAELEYRLRRRVERSDFVTRLGPMLGLMGTLIPLGPGLAALGLGDFGQLTSAITIAFDTTVLGLLVGMTGFVISRLRRRWYDKLLDQRLQQQPQSIPLRMAS